MEYPGVINAYRSGEFIHAAMNEVNMQNIVREFLEDRGQENVEVKTVVPDVEDCFMKFQGSNVPEFQVKTNNQ
jgi:hypothetical protein